MNGTAEETSSSGTGEMGKSESKPYGSACLHSLHKDLHGIITKHEAMMGKQLEHSGVREDMGAHLDGLHEMAKAISADHEEHYPDEEAPPDEYPEDEGGEEGKENKEASMSANDTTEGGALRAMSSKDRRDYEGKGAQEGRKDAEDEDEEMDEEESAAIEKAYQAEMERSVRLRKAVGMED